MKKLCETRHRPRSLWYACIFMNLFTTGQLDNWGKSVENFMFIPSSQQQTSRVYKLTLSLRFAAGKILPPLLPMSRFISYTFNFAYTGYLSSSYCLYWHSKLVFYCSLLCWKSTRAKNNQSIISSSSRGANK